MRVHIVDIVDSHTDTREQEQRMRELEQLVSTYGWLVIVKTLQKRQSPDYKTFVGRGKLEEILEDMIITESDLLLVGNILKPAQIFSINEFIRTHPLMKDYPHTIQAWDKVDLILKIFDKHAKNTEAKLQIQLAAIRHMGPRIFGMGIEMSKQGWSSGWGWGAMRGLGETNTERMRRHLKDETYLIEKKLQKYENMRDMHRQRRKKLWLPSFGVVGYTNAWKSSLMNALTKKWVYADNKLFATLGTRVGKVYLPPQVPSPSLQSVQEKLADISDNKSLSKQESSSLTDRSEALGQEVLMIDTIGFIRDLPPQLIKAFASTLEDSIQSDILLHVIDAHDPDILTKVDTVEEILERIGADQPMLYILNKSDLISDKNKEEIADQFYGKDMIFVSSETWEGLEELKEKMAEMVNI